MLGMKDLVLSNVVINNPLECTVEENFFLSTINFIQEMDMEYYTARKCLNVVTLEAVSYEVLHEGFESYKDKIKAIISKFYKFLKSMFERFITALNKMVKSEKYLRGKDRVLAEFNSDDEFEYNGYTFTIDPMIPVLNIVKEFGVDFVGLDPDKISNRDYISGELDKLTNEADSDTYYDIIRGEVIGMKDKPIYKEDFANVLFSIFRNGEDTKSAYDITSSEVIKNFGIMKDHEKTISSIKKDKARIEKEYKTLEKKIDGILSKSSTDATGVVNLILGYDNNPGTYNIDKDTMIKVDAFIATKCNQVKEISNIHALAFAAKLEAEKDSYKQSKDILYKALSKIEKRKSKGV